MSIVGANPVLAALETEPTETAGEVVVVGRLGEQRREEIAHAAARASAHSRVCSTVAQAREALGAPGASAPKCIVVDAELPDLADLVSWVRGQGRLFSVPVVVQVAGPSDPAFVRSHAIGADDVVIQDDLGAITRRLANLATFDPAARPPLTQGRAVVGHDDEARRKVLGRILRQAGFDLAFASSASELVRVAGGGEAPSLLVASEALGGGDVVEALRGAREACGVEDVPGVLLAGEGDPRTLRERAEVLGSVAITPEAAPADNLLFLANELMRPGVKDVRASTRLLYGSICGFRPAGTLQPVYGLSYNISREGLYVRTLDPPTAGSSLWFEMRPPYADEVAHLRGKVVWSRGLDHPGGAAPPGFGLRIEEQACPPNDLARYRESYEALHDELVLTR